MSATVADTSRTFTPMSHVTNPPSASRAVWMIAVREVTEQLTSLRFLIITFMVVGLTPLAVYVGTRDYLSRLNDYNRLKRPVNKSPLDPRKRDSRDGIVRRFDNSQGNSLTGNAQCFSAWPDGALPQYWDFLPTGLVAGTAATRAQRLADVLGTLDLEFWFVLLLVYWRSYWLLTQARGKELNTQGSFEQPISRSALLGRKANRRRNYLAIAINRRIPIGTNYRASISR